MVVKDRGCLEERGNKEGKKKKVEICNCVGKWVGDLVWVWADMHARLDITYWRAVWHIYPPFSHLHESWLNESEEGCVSVLVFVYLSGWSSRLTVVECLAVSYAFPPKTLSFYLPSDGHLSLAYPQHWLALVTSFWIIKHTSVSGNNLPPQATGWEACLFLSVHIHL